MKKILGILCISPVVVLIIVFITKVFNTLTSNPSDADIFALSIVFSIILAGIICILAMLGIMLPADSNNKRK